MTDKVLISDPRQVRVEYVNHVLGQGCLNGVANITLGTMQFSPTADGKIDADLVITARLRMDLTCVQQLRDACDSILQANLKPANGTAH